MLLLVRRRAAVTGLNKELLFMGKVEAAIRDKLIENAFERLPRATSHNSIVQIVNQDRQLLMVVIQQLYVHAHSACPDNERHLEGSFPDSFSCPESVLEGIFSPCMGTCKPSSSFQKGIVEIVRRGR